MRSNKPNLQSNRLHLGCGTRAADDWLNVDGSFQVVLSHYPLLWQFVRHFGLLSTEKPWPRNILWHDARKKLPFPDDSFIAVYASHLLEHLYRSEALLLLKEARRVLCPRGVCRVVVPDLEYLVQQYANAKQFSAGREATAAENLLYSLHMQPKQPPTINPLLRVYRLFYDFQIHKWMYDRASLAALFEEAGFHSIAAKVYLDSAIPGLEQVESASRVLDGKGICIEGIKP